MSGSADAPGRQGPSRLALGVLVVAGLGLAGLGSFFLIERSREAAETKRRDDLEYAARWDLDHGQPQQALEKLEALAQVDPARRGLRALLGRALVSNGRAAEGARALDEAVSAGGADAEALEFAGVAQSQLGALPQAKAALTKALELEPKRVSAWRRLAQVCLTSGDLKAAVESWRQAVGNAPPAERPTIRVEARTLLEQAGHPDEARGFAEPP